VTGLVLINRTTGSVIAGRAQSACGFWSRFRGLMGRRTFPAGSALVLTPCKQVHTFFMRFTIDIVFLDGQGVVIEVLPGMSPWKISPFVGGARSVVELPAGVVESTGTARGHMLELI